MFLHMFLFSIYAGYNPNTDAPIEHELNDHDTFQEKWLHHADTFLPREY